MYRTIPLTVVMILALLWTACFPPQAPEPDTAVMVGTPVALEGERATDWSPPQRSKPC